MRRARGFTLIELSIALIIAAVLFAAVTVSVGALTGSRARASAGELAGVIRALFDTAALNGKTCRLVFDIADPRTGEPTRYRAECAAGNVTTSRDREALLSEDSRSRDERPAAGEEAGRPTDYRDANAQPNLDELLAQERGRVENAARFSGFSTEEIRPRELPSGVQVGVWTRHQHERVTQGLAYLYFFPQGFTERAHVYLRQGDNVWTLAVQPLTGKVVVVAEELEVPRS
jgi:general secretion pathway protein H